MNYDFRVVERGVEEGFISLLVQGFILKFWMQGFFEGNVILERSFYRDES